MNKEQILGAIRPVVTAVLTLVAAKYFQDGSVLEGAISSVFAAVAVIWGIVDKTEKGLNPYFSAARHILAAVSGVLVALIPESKATEIIGIVLTLLTALSGGLAQKAK